MRKTQLKTSAWAYLSILREEEAHYPIFLSSLLPLSPLSSPTESPSPRFHPTRKQEFFAKIPPCACFCGVLGIYLVLWNSDPWFRGPWEEEVGRVAGGDLAGRRWPAGRSRSRSGSGCSTARTSGPASTTLPPPSPRSRSSSSLGGRKRSSWPIPPSRTDVDAPYCDKMAA
ncbi:uncharacterized protein LOC133919844 isoform X1 [Phragmites australis]|uniref:uncharacterized protein LOC133919844 isoform X1 n=1 Tax=Phragmites australis TaxID=29695 RepID=UPI002D7861EC|nr:uncharacterized protein LOC133919844 isoform X1 [Phragmites australis]